MTSKPDADARLVDAHDLALAALREITPASTIGPAAGYLAEDDGSVSLRFQNRLPGYPGWFWTVTVARVDDEEPTVLEVELLPGDGALLVPEWVPWVERLAEYRSHQAELAEQAAADVDADDRDDAAEDEDGDLDDDELDDDELDDDDDELDDAAGGILHAGDVDGVDIDELDVSAPTADAETPEGDESDDDDESGEDDEDDEDESDDGSDDEDDDSDEE